MNTRRQHFSTRSIRRYYYAEIDEYPWCYRLLGT